MAANERLAELDTQLDERRRNGPAPLTDVEPRTLDEVVDVYRRYEYLPHPGVLYAVFGAAAANYIDGDPVWLLVVGAPGSGKTEALQGISRLPHVYQAATLTEPALLSGSPQRERSKGAKGGLLRELGEFGIILHKDFGSVLSMHRDARAAALAALREVYDGSWTRHVGSDGGRALHWSGKAGLLAGCTPTVDRHTGAMAALGTRFLLYRVPPVARERQAGTALGRGRKTAAMRAELATAVSGLFVGLPVEPEPLDLDEQTLSRIARLSDFTTLARSAVERDGYSREVELVPDPEMPARLALTLRQMLDGLSVIGANRETAWSLVTKCALDSVPALRLAALDALSTANEPLRTAEVATEIAHPTKTTHRTLEDLQAHGLAVRHPGGEGKADRWELPDSALQNLEAIRENRDRNVG